MTAWNNQQTDAGCQVLECANEDELMRDLSETLKPYSASNRLVALPLLGEWSIWELCGRSFCPPVWQISSRRVALQRFNCS